MTASNRILPLHKYGFVFLVLALLVSLASAAPVYYVSFTGTDAGISYSTLWIGEGDSPLSIEGGTYTAEIVDISSKVRHTTTFQPSLGPFILTLPYFGNGQAIVIKDKIGRVLFDLPTSQFIHTCGDAVCQNYEHRLSCPADCFSETTSETEKENEKCFRDGYCDESCDDDPDCSSIVLDSGAGALESVKGPEPASSIASFFQKNTFSWLLAVFILATILLLLFVQASHKKTRRKEMAAYIQENLQRGYSGDDISAALQAQGTSDKDIKQAWSDFK